MPSSMTHTYFGMDVYQKLPLKYQNKINLNLEYFKLFCQGSDPFMFYHFLIGKKAKQMKEIQKQIHQEKTQEFFLNTIKYIHKYKLQNNQEIMSYLYGNICHYFLDLYTHPFIYYKSGIFNPKDKKTYQYNGIHQKIEYAIDLYLISQKEKKDPSKFKIHQEIFKITTISLALIELIENSIGKTYSIKNSATKYQKSVKYMKKFFYVANYDPSGLKLKIYQLIDKITPKSIIKIEELSYKNNYKNISDYLNLTHKKWNYPWNKNLISTCSFLDLYEKAKNDAINTIKEITDLLEYNKLNIKRIKLIFSDLSYTTGKPCQEKLEMKYFELKKNYKRNLLL